MNSEAYQKLHETALTVEIDAKDHARIAVHFLLIPMRFKWNPRVAQEVKDDALELLPGLTDSEWEQIREHMLVEVADSTFAAKRMEWVRALDTYREFERE